KLGPAIASYQRAFDILPRDADIRYNLNFALKRAGEELRPEGTPPALFYLFTLLSERELAGVHWIFCWCALLLASLYLLDFKRRDGLRPWLTAAMIVWAGAGVWWGSRLLIEPDRRGVILKP